MLDYFSNDPDLPQVSTTTTSPSACSTPSPRISCCPFRTTKWCTARARCSTKCRATNGGSSPTCAPSWRTCGRIPARSCCSWARRSASARSGTTIAGMRWELLEFDPHRKLQALVRELNRLYRASPALYQVDFHYTGFEWVDFHDWENSVIAFLRRAEDPDRFPAVLLQLHSGGAQGLRVRRAGRGLLRRDPEYGFGVVRRIEHGQRRAGLARVPFRKHNRAHSIAVTLPPLAVVAFRKR